MILTAKPQNGRTCDKARCISSLIRKGTKSTFRVRAACWESTNVVTAGHTYTRLDPWPDDNKLNNVTRITHYRVTDYRWRVIAVIFFVRVISDMSRSSTTFETIWHLSSELINEILYKYRESIKAQWRKTWLQYFRVLFKYIFPFVNLFLSIYFYASTYFYSIYFYQFNFSSVHFYFAFSFISFFHIFIMFFIQFFLMNHSFLSEIQFVRRNDFRCQIFHDFLSFLEGLVC